MKKKLVAALGILLLTLCGQNLFAQRILKGTVTDTQGQAIPGVRVYVENTTYGMITDYNGGYFLELKDAGTYLIHFKMLGMKDTLAEVLVTGKITELNIVLVENVHELGSVEVVTKKENVANGIIRHVQDNRKNFALQFDNYTCNTYLKTSLQKEKIRPDDEDSLEKGPVKMSLIESLSKSTFIATDTYHETILAHHDYSDKEASSTSSVVDYFMDDIIVPVQNIEVDPYLFFEKIQDGDFNLYQNMLNLPKISEYPITSPIGLQAFTNYKFKLTNVFTESEQKIYEIQVTPRFSGAALLEGSLYIIDSLWVIKSFNLSVNPGTMVFFKEFTVIHDYEQIDGFWVPVRREFIYSIREEGYIITANTRVNHSSYQFNQTTTINDFKNEASHYTDDAFSKDSAFWAQNRPLLLKQEELDFIAEQNRIDSIKQSEYYLDSLDADFNRITFFDVTLNGVGLRNRFKQQEIYISPLFSNLELLGVGGFRYGFSGSYSKKFENSQKIKVKPAINFGIHKLDLKPSLELDYTFLPLKFGSIELEGGDVYQLLTNQLSMVNWLLSGTNSVRNRYVSIAHRRELVNGLYGRIKFSYSDRQSVNGADMGPIVDYIQSIDTVINFINEPIQFQEYKVALLELKFQYRFKQQYIIKKNEKLIIGTEYPELEMTFKQGIPALFDSEVSFNVIEFKVSDEISFGNFGVSKWKVIGGSFLNTKDVRVIEYKYVKQSDMGLFSNPLNTHQLLDTTYSTTGAYVQAFYLHHFNGVLINKIPILNKTKFETIAGVSLLYIDEFNLIHTEFFVGVERKFKLFNQYLKYGFYYSGQFDDLNNSYFKLKIGFDYLNTFTNKWSY
ncbi:MAG: carboxypeptidase-like regulatory domain-containing protein [Bacteroidetes bacterium]|nr:carboxypeptidase-like regulatory domain-containing protein [Bacteroidota bacterium]